MFMYIVHPPLGLLQVATYNNFNFNYAFLQANKNKFLRKKKLNNRQLKYLYVHGPP